MFKSPGCLKTSLVLLGILMAAADARATKYVCDGWEYDDGSRSSKAVKFEIDYEKVKVDGYPYVIAGESFDLYNSLDEVFLVLDRVKMDGSRPANVYHVILDPCTEWDGYANMQQRLFHSCKQHELVRVGTPITANWILGMSKTKCVLF